MKRRGSLFCVLKVGDGLSSGFSKFPQLQTILAMVDWEIGRFEWRFCS